MQVLDSFQCEILYRIQFQFTRIIYFCLFLSFETHFVELGGNAAFIVFEDANIDEAVTAAIASKFRNAGQTCVCADRFLIHESVEEEFLSKFIAKVRELKVGPGSMEGVTMGPLISTKSTKIVQTKVDDAIKEGGECLLGGSLLPELGANFFEPTVIRNVSRKSALWQSETFGPVAAISTFQTEEEAIEAANDTTSGLASYFCSQDLERVFRVAGR